MALSNQATRTLFHLGLVLSFLTGVVFKQFDIWHSLPFVFIAFAGALSILIEYTLRIRKESILWLIPAFLSVELLATIVSKAGLPDIAFVLYIPGALTFLVYGVLFIRAGIVKRNEGKGIMVKFLGLGILAGGLSAWEAITYAPDRFNYFHIGWRTLFLVVFAWLLLVDMTTNFRKYPRLKIEGEIVRISLLVIAWMYFDRFIFQ